MEFKNLTEEELKEFAENPRFTHFVGMIFPRRPGVLLCATRLEHEHFIPGTPKNRDFQLLHIQWEGILWLVTSIPTEEVHHMHRIASETGLRVADGVPTLISESGTIFFPMNSKRVFTLENVSGHPIYRGNPDEIKALLEKEDAEVKEIISRHASGLRKEEDPGKTVVLTGKIVVEEDKN